MEKINIAREFALLPPEAQKQLVDFMAFLKMRYPISSAVKKVSSMKLIEEPFVGMWRGREDMVDSTKWVRELRQREWE